MVTVPQSLSSDKSHRRAYGVHRPTTPQQRAQYVAESIALRQAEGRSWTWADYGLTENLTQQALVVAALHQGR
jgi:hypothetical protein